MNSKKYFVKVRSSNLDKRDPEFRGVLYEARDNPEEGELVLKSDELKNLNTIGGPICFEHDRKIGKIGVITNCSYEHPHYYIDGVVNTANLQLKEQVRHMLKSGELGMLSIGFKAIYDNSSKEFSDKQFEEASLVRKGFYPTTKIVSVAASAEKGQSSEDFKMLEDDREVLDFLKNYTNSNDSIGRNNYINQKDSDSTKQNFINNSIPDKNNLQKHSDKSKSTMTSLGNDDQAIVPPTQSKQTNETQKESNEQTDMEDEMNVDSENESTKTRQERENELLSEQEKLKKQHDEAMKAIQEQLKEQDNELKQLRLMKKKQNEEYVKKFKPIVEEMVKEHKKNGETKLAIIVEHAAKNMSQKDVLLGLVRQYKDNKAKDQRIKELEKKTKRIETPNQRPISVASSAKKNSKTVAKRIEDQTVDEFLDSICQNTKEESENDSASTSNQKVESKNSHPNKFSNQTTLGQDEEEEIKDADPNAEIDLKSEREKKIKDMSSALIEAVTVNCSKESKKMITEKFEEAPLHFPGALNRVHPALGLEFAKIHYGIEINV